MKNLELKFEIFKQFGSQKAFAEKLKVHESVVSKIINGYHKLSQKKAARWETLLNCDSALIESVTE